MANLEFLNPNEDLKRNILNRLANVLYIKPGRKVLDRYEDLLIIEQRMANALGDDSLIQLNKVCTHTVERIKPFSFTELSTTLKGVDYRNRMPPPTIKEHLRDILTSYGKDDFYEALKAKKKIEGDVEILKGLANSLEVAPITIQMVLTDLILEYKAANKKA